jgi:3-oxoacyl-[acyl-carrier-protein] synthase III
MRPAYVSTIEGMPIGREYASDYFVNKFPEHDLKYYIDYFGVENRFAALKHEDEPQTTTSILHFMRQTMLDSAQHLCERMQKRSAQCYSNIDTIIFCSGSSLFFLPNAAAELQRRINISSIKTMEIKGGCASVLSGINVASSFVQTGKSDTVLVIGCDVFACYFYNHFLRSHAAGKRPDKNSIVNMLLFSDGVSGLLVSKYKSTDDVCYQIDYCDYKSLSDQLPSGFEVSFEYSDPHLPIVSKNHHIIIRKNMPYFLKQVFGYFDSKIDFGLIKSLIIPQANQSLINNIFESSQLTYHKDCEIEYFGDRIGNAPSASLLLALSMSLKRKKKAPESIAILAIETASWTGGILTLARAT